MRVSAYDTGAVVQRLDRNLDDGRGTGLEGDLEAAQLGDDLIVDRQPLPRHTGCCRSGPCSERPAAAQLDETREAVAPLLSARFSMVCGVGFTTMRWLSSVCVAVGSGSRI